MPEVWRKVDRRGENRIGRKGGERMTVQVKFKDRNKFEEVTEESAF